MNHLPFKYEKLPLNIFLKDHHESIANSLLFEFTPVWLQANAQHMLTRNDQVWVHCLFDAKHKNQKKLLIAWPLVHKVSGKQQVISSLSSFYSAVTMPFLSESDASRKCMKEEQMNYTHSDSVISNHLLIEYFSTLLTYVKKDNTWQQMLLGSFELNSVFVEQIYKQFSFVKTYACADNWYCENIETFQNYYSQRPSQLKNTIKRKKKKLAADHHYHSKIIIEPAEFKHFFSDYQRIYRLSWKGDEYSFEFIKHVCLQAAAQNKLRMGILFVDDQAVAMQLWFLQNNTASIFKLAYDPDYKAYSVGSILSMALSEHVIEYDKVTCIEFGMGSEPYKKDWMDQKQERVTLQVFNERTFMGLLGAAKHIILSKLKLYLPK